VKTEAALRGKSIEAGTLSGARDALAAEISPISDIRSTRDYRLRVSLNLLEDFLSKLAS
jgi:xanthine dehydrogenase small subunit